MKHDAAGVVQVWNTGRPYAAAGQRMAAMVVPSRSMEWQVAFADCDRYIAGVTNTGLSAFRPMGDVRAFVMDAYDHGLYRSDVFRWAKDHVFGMRGELEEILTAAARAQAPGAAPFDKTTVAAQRGDAFAAWLADKYRESNVSFGYIGNLDRNRDDRSWCFFYRDPAKSGAQSFGSASTEQLAAVVAYGMAHFENCVRASLGLRPVVPEVVRRDPLPGCVETGEYCGRIVSVDGDAVLQDVGRGGHVRHDARRIGGMVKEGREVFIQYGAEGVAKASLVRTPEKAGVSR